MRIVGYSASPRRAGSTAWAVESILKGAQAHGAQAQLWHAGTAEVRPCQGCLACAQGDGCVLQDGMQPIYAALKEADALVLGVPIYMGQMSAQAKAFTDRLFAQITPRFSQRFKEENAGKKLVLVFTQGNPDSGRFQAYYDYTKSMFQMLEFDVRDMVIITGTRSTPASESAEWHTTLRDIGTALCE